MSLKNIQKVLLYEIGLILDGKDNLILSSLSKTFSTHFRTDYYIDLFIRTHSPNSTNSISKLTIREKLFLIVRY